MSFPDEHPQDQQLPRGMAQQVEANRKESSPQCVRACWDLQARTVWAKKAVDKDKKIGFSQDKISLEEYVREISAHTAT